MSESEKSIADVAVEPLGKAGEIAETASSVPQERRIGHWVALFLFVISGIALAPWIGGASETNPARHADVPQAGGVQDVASNPAPAEQGVTYSAIVTSGEGAVLSASAPDYDSLSGNNAEGIIDPVVQTAAELTGGIGSGGFGGSGSAGGSASRGSGGGLPSGAGFPSALRPAGLGTGGGSGPSFLPTGSPSPSPTPPNSPPPEGNPDPAPPEFVAEPTAGPELPPQSQSPRNPPDPAAPPTPPLPEGEGPGPLPDLPPGLLPPQEILPASTEPFVDIAAVPTPGTALLILLAFPLLLFFHRRIVPQRP